MDKTQIKHRGGRPRKYACLGRRNCSGEEAALVEIAALGGGSFSAGVAFLYARHLSANGKDAKRGRPPAKPNGAGRRGAPE